MEIEQTTRDIHPELLKTAKVPDLASDNLHSIMEDVCLGQKLKLKCMSQDAEGVHSSGKSGFFDAIFYAYYNHLPLKLTPDDVWIAIMQAVSLHVTNKSEALRDRFVNFPDKKQLTVVIDPWTNSENDWQRGFQGFSTLINQNLIPEAQGLVKPKFSTTTALASAVCDVAIMDCFKNYFKYSLRGGCGIPKVTLTGTLADWQLLKSQAEKLVAYSDLGWWLPYILPILEEFIKFVQGTVNLKFWDCIIKPCPASGSGNYFWKEGYHEKMSGWFSNFYPHTVTPVMGFVSGPQLENMKNTEAKNRAMLTLQELYQIHDEFEKHLQGGDSKILSEYMKKLNHGFEIKYLPSNMSTAEVDFENLQTKEKYKAMIRAGFFGFHYSPLTHEVSPALGWFVGAAN